MSMPSSHPDWPFLHRVLAVIMVLVLMAGLRLAAPVLIPLVLALFLTLVLLPLDRGIARLVPDKLAWLGRLIVMILLVLAVVLFIGGLAFCMQQIATHLPDLTEKMDAFLSEMDTNGSTSEKSMSRSQIAMLEIGGMIREEAGTIGKTLIEKASGFAATLANMTGVVVAGIVVVLFMVLLALSEAATWRKKRKVLDHSDGQRWDVVLDTLERTLGRFLAVRAGVGLLSAVIYTLWLLPFGLELLAVWAVLTFLMNFIPNLGAIVAVLLPTVYAFLTLDPATALLLGAGLFLIEQIIGNLVDPRLQGQQIALSPLVILVAVLLWGWVWGVAGAFLGTPATLSIMVVCNRLPKTRPIALFLSNQTSHEALDQVLGFGPARSETTA